MNLALCDSFFQDGVFQLVLNKFTCVVSGSVRTSSSTSTMASSSTLSTIESFIKDPKYAEYLALVKGARNGLVYGARIRFPHALVMAILFGKGE